MSTSDEVGVVPAWCATADDLDECKRAAHDQLIKLMGARRRGAVMWRIFSGADAVRVASAMRDDALLHLEFEHHRQYVEVLGKLDGGGLLVLACAPAWSNS